MDAPEAPRLLHYALLQELGEGAAGQVYRARDLKLNRLVALKFLKEGASTFPSRRSR